jgi:hypothetical protein
MDHPFFLRPKACLMDEPSRLTPDETLCVTEWVTDLARVETCETETRGPLTREEETRLVVARGFGLLLRALGAVVLTVVCVLGALVV